MTKRNRNSPFVRRNLVWNTRHHETRTNWLYCGNKKPFVPENPLLSISHEGTVTPRYLSLSITDPVTSHCITLTLLGSTIKLQEPSQETRNWGLPTHINPPLAIHI